MIKWRCKIRYGMCMVFLLALLTVIGTYVSIRMTKTYVISKQQAMIGRIYKQNPVLCEEVLQEMFEEINEADMAAGKAALLEFGYTQDGLDYLYMQSGQKEANDIVLFVQIGLAGGILLCVWQFLRIQEKQMERQMYIEIGSIFEQSEKEIKVSKDIAQRFVENIAHQIKTPLACISLSLDMLQEMLKDNGQREMVKETFVYLKQIEVLMKRLLDIGRLESGKLMLQKEIISLEEILYSCAKNLDAKEERVAVEIINETETTPEFYGDYDWLKEAFSNILKNALEHDQSKTKVLVTLRYQKELIFVQIRDHGDGISKKDIKYIFDRFYIPVHAKKGHTGVGLNLAKLVIEKHFGTIEAINCEEGGTLISICFSLYGLKNKKM